MIANDADFKIGPALCPLCGSEMQPWFSVNGDWQRPETKGRVFAVRRCPRDGFGQVLPTPKRAELLKHYDLERYYTRGAGSPENRGRSRFVGLLERIAFRLDNAGFGRREFLISLPQDRSRRILDIGCGNGAVMEFAAGLGHDVYGVEPDANARSRQADFRFPVWNGTAEDLPPQTAGKLFDAIVMVHVAEHVADPAVCFENVAHLLAPGGLAYIETPNCACADFHGARLSWPHLEIPRHLNFWTADLLSEMGLRHGLETVAIGHVGYTRQFGQTWFRNGIEIAAYHKPAPLLSRCRAFGGLYLLWLLATTAAASNRRKYDASLVVLRKPDYFLNSE